MWIDLRKGDGIMQKVALEMSVSSTLERTPWDLKLTKGKQNEYPLAPKNLVAKGKVTSENYRQQNELWGRFVYDIMIAELATGIGCIQILGAGLLRDLKWIPDAVKSGSLVSITDGSRVACKNATRFLRKSGLLQQVSVVHTEVLAGWDSGEIEDKETTAYFMSQFLEHQGYALPDFIFNLIGFLRLPGRRVLYVALPRAEDNDPIEVLWESAVLPYDIDWLGKLVRLVNLNTRVLGTHEYFNRKYTFFRLES